MPEGLVMTLGFMFLHTGMYWTVIRVNINYVCLRGLIIKRSAIVRTGHFLLGTA
jgi:hypothetical protein